MPKRGSRTIPRRSTRYGSSRPSFRHHPCDADRVPCSPTHDRRRGPGVQEVQRSRIRTASAPAASIKPSRFVRNRRTTPLSFCSHSSAVALTCQCPAETNLSVDALQIRDPGELVDIACRLELRGADATDAETVDRETIGAPTEEERAAPCCSAADEGQLHLIDGDPADGLRTSRRLRAGLRCRRDGRGDEQERLTGSGGGLAGRCIGTSSSILGWVWEWFAHAMPAGRDRLRPSDAPVWVDPARPDEGGYPSLTRGLCLTVGDDLLTVWAIDAADSVRNAEPCRPLRVWPDQNCTLDIEAGHRPQAPRAAYQYAGATMTRRPSR